MICDLWTKESDPMICDPMICSRQGPGHLRAERPAGLFGKAVPGDGRRLTSPATQFREQRLHAVGP